MASKKELLDFLTDLIVVLLLALATSFVVDSFWRYYRPPLVWGVAWWVFIMLAKVIRNGGI